MSDHIVLACSTEHFTSAFSLSPSVATNCARVGFEFSVAKRKVTAPIENVTTVVSYIIILRSKLIPQISAICCSSE